MSLRSKVETNRHHQSRYKRMYICQHDNKSPSVESRDIFETLYMTNAPLTAKMSVVTLIEL